MGDDGAAKLVRCGRGAILDVVVDLRRGSPSFGQWEAFEAQRLESAPALLPDQLLLHSFCTLSEIADVLYKQAPSYDESIERGIAYDDPDVGIAWPAGIELAASRRDATAPPLRDVAEELPFRYAG